MSHARLAPWPATDDVMRMRPPVFWASICGTTYLTASQHPFRLTSSIMSHHSSVMSPRRHIGDARVADQDIDVPELLDGFLDGRFHILGATHVSFLIPKTLRPSP